MLLQPNDSVVFTGDSITDCGRPRDESGLSAMGNGYALMAASQLACRFPDWNLTWTNSGISGNRIHDLEARLEADVMAHRPTLVSILIGINDTARDGEGNSLSPIDQFDIRYRRILSRISESGARLLILEPFLLPVPDERREARLDLNERIEICRNLAREFHAAYLPTDGLFASVSTRCEPAFWLYDGVHPTPAGHALMANAWLETVTN